MKADLVLRDGLVVTQAGVVLRVGPWHRRAAAGHPGKGRRPVPEHLGRACRKPWRPRLATRPADADTIRRPCGRISMEDLVRVTATGTAWAFGLYPSKGALVPGADADLVSSTPTGRRSTTTTSTTACAR
jgi:N-acyl-D-aspartate/D-glutamate deacylase